jgi:CBS domain-containing protein
MIINEIMSRNVVSIPSSATLKEAAKVMKKYDIGFLVVHDEKLEGVITDRDIVLGIANGNDVNDSVKYNLKKHIITCYETDDVSDASDKMGNYQIKRIVILNDKDEVSGILSLSDISRNYETEENALEALMEISYHFV